MVDKERRTKLRHLVDHRLFASIDGHTVVLRDISQSGISLYSDDLIVGSMHMLEFNQDHHHMTLAIEIVDKSGDRLLHARFVSPSAETEQLINHIVNGLM